MYNSDGEGLYPFEIRERTGSKDRANTRRSLRSLLRRGLIEYSEAKDGHLKLTFWGSLAVSFLAEPELPDPLDEMKKRAQAFEEGLAAWRAEREEERRLWFEEEDRWEKNRKGTYQRDRFPGQNQLRVLAVLYRYPPDLQRGLPKKAVEQIVGGDKRNTARAIRTLVERGMIQRSKDDKRLRLPGATPPGSRIPFFSFWVCAPDILEDPLDDEKAEMVLEAFGESWEGVA